MDCFWKDLALCQQQLLEDQKMEIYWLWSSAASGGEYFVENQWPPHAADWDTSLPAPTASCGEDRATLLLDQLTNTNVAAGPHVDVDTVSKLQELERNMAALARSLGHEVAKSAARKFDDAALNDRLNSKNWSSLPRIFKN